MELYIIVLYSRTKSGTSSCFEEDVVEAKCSKESCSVLGKKPKFGLLVLYKSPFGRRLRCIINQQLLHF